jgi:hypothetical protein
MVLLCAQDSSGLTPAGGTLVQTHAH